MLGDARVEELLAAFDGVRLLVVGDAFLDEYLYGDAMRVSPEAPVPVVHVAEESSVLGGAGNVARNIVALGGQCAFCSVVGEDAAGDRVIALLDDLGVSARGVLRAPDRPTTHKTRVVARRQQIVRIDRETHEPLQGDLAARLLAQVEDAMPMASAVVIEDYAKGLLTVEVGRAVTRLASQARLPVNVDPKRDLEPFRGASLVKPNLAEAEAITGLQARAGLSGMSGSRMSDSGTSGSGASRSRTSGFEASGLEAIGRRIQKLVGGGDVVISLGGDGLAIVEGDRPIALVPTLRQAVFDVQGAGDTIIATLSLARQAGASLWEATVLANAAASVVVGKAGTATADRRELRAVLPGVREVALAASGMNTTSGVEEQS